MANGEILSSHSRPPTDAEQDLGAWFEQQEGAVVDNLEGAARQLITLVTTFFGFLFGVLALGSDKLEASLRTAGAVGLGWLAVGLLLAALIASLGVVWPRRYRYRDARLDQMKAVYRQMIAAKTRWLQGALIAFGGGLAAFAGLILALLAGRL